MITAGRCGRIRRCFTNGCTRDREMNAMNWRRNWLLMLTALLVLPGRCLAVGQTSKRAVVGDLVNNTKDRHSTIIRVASDAVATERTRGEPYKLPPRREVPRPAKARRLPPPYHEDDLFTIAKDIDAPFLV